MTRNRTFTVIDRETGYSVVVSGNRFTLLDSRDQSVLRWTASTAGRGDQERIAEDALAMQRSVMVD